MIEQKRIVGILGGKGPEATAELLQHIIKNTPASTEEEHLRIIIDNNPSIPKPSLGITGEGEDPMPALAETARNLERAGAGFIAIPCNSVHYYLPQIRQAVRIPVISIIDETVSYVKQKGCQKVGLLATTGLVQANLYQTKFENAGISVHTPDTSQQACMMNAILVFKDKGQMAPLTGILINMCESFIRKGIDGLVLGCTEIPIALAGHEFPRRATAFDTLEILALACIREAQRG